MSVSFKIFDTTLSFHEDLRKYYDLFYEFQSAHSELDERVDKLFNYQTKPSELLEKIKNECKGFIIKLINKLSSFGMFDRVANDYLNSNTGYLKLINCTADYYEYCDKSSKKHSLLAESKKASADASMNSSITGLDFGIITDNIIDYAVYASMNKREISEQTLAAAVRYSHACDEIDKEKDINIAVDSEMYYSNQYIPSVKSALKETFLNLLATYVNDLSSCGQLDLHCLDKISVKRSNEIIDNIVNMDNKKAVFIKSLELCPFNVNTYYKGYKELFVPNGINFSDTCGELIKYFNLEKQLQSILVPVTRLSEQAKTCLLDRDYSDAKNKYSEIASLYPNNSIGWVGLLLCETRSFTQYNPSLETIENLYQKAVSTIDKTSKYHLEKDYGIYKMKVLEYNHRLKEFSDLESLSVINSLRMDEEKKLKKWTYLSITFGVISLLGLVCTFVSISGIFLFLFFSVVTAALVYCYYSTKKEINKYDNEIKLHKEKQEEINKLRNSFFNQKGYNLEDLL